MRIDAVIVGDAPEVTTEIVAAQAVQPWMLLYDISEDDLQVVTEDPEPFRPETPAGRPERWVTLTVLDDEPITAAATAGLEVVLGAEVEDLQPLFPEDLYTPQEWALAYNGMCQEKTDDGDEEDDDEEPVWCGRPSDPVSLYRSCTEHDEARRRQSETVAARGYEPTYGAIAELA